jgi:ParB family chromosome partitioning protein
MSRKNLLLSLTERKLTAVNSPAEQSADSTLTPAMERNRNRGAFGAITRSIDELAEKAQAVKEFEAKLLEGATVVELDPEQIDVSFVADRIEEDEAAFEELVAAIRERGQDSPILVRPHPDQPDRYMTVFGHRRLRAAKALGRKVRAVIKSLDDREHVIAQGQENSARADLSFIEKAMFAARLEARGYEREVIMSALSVDKTVVSKMISVTKDIPNDIVSAIGPARNSGRDKWYKVAIKLRSDEALEKVRGVIGSPDFQNLDSDARLEFLDTGLDKASAPKRKETTKAPVWRPSDGKVAVAMKAGRASYTLELTDKDAKLFGAWLAGNLESLYEAFRKANS